MNSATVKISTTLYSEKSGQNKLTVMKPGDKVTNVTYHRDKTWMCRCTWTGKITIAGSTTTTSMSGYARYFINGNVHISGTGVTAAITGNGGKIGNSKTGYQTGGSSSPSSLTGSGVALKDVNVRKAASEMSSIVGLIPKSTSFVKMSKINTKTGWCYVSAMGILPNKQFGMISGYVQYKSSSTTWIKATNVSGGSLSDVNSNKSVGKVTSNSSNNKENFEEAVQEVEDSKFIPVDTSMTSDTTDYDAFSKKFSQFTKSKEFVKSVRGIYGMPYQFMNIVDPKLHDEDGNKGSFGRVYGERILAKMPLLILSPGQPKYMPNYSNTNIKKDIITSLAEVGLDGLQDLLNDIVGEEGDGKFYTFEHAYDQYFDYVNPMCQQLALYLGLKDERIPLSNGGKGKPYTMLWQKYQNAYLNEYTSTAACVGFYIDAESQMSESFSNNTSESQFASAVNGVNDLSREIQFLMGGATGSEFSQLVNTNFSDAFSEIESFTDKYVQVLPGLLTSRLKNTFDTIKVGGQLVFPEIWNDSDFGRSYDINIKLRTPDGDNFSWFMNIGVPLMHLLGFTLPKRLGYNGIQSPFLVRAYYKGFFNVNMGIVTSMNISKGDKCKWTLQGLPTDIDVSFNIKDLYQSLSMAPTCDFNKNTDQLDYIANLCGININKPDILRTVILGYNKAKLAGLTTLTNNGFLGVNQAIDNFKLGLYEKFIR